MFSWHWLVQRNHWSVQRRPSCSQLSAPYHSFRGEEDDVALEYSSATVSVVGLSAFLAADRHPRYLTPSFRTCYEKFCQDKNLKANIVTFKSGFEGFWMGDPGEKYVFIYFHGR